MTPTQESDDRDWFLKASQRAADLRELDRLEKEATALIVKLFGKDIREDD